ncbi:MAG: hypothetical protein Q8N63_02985 [Nanoarchaeota archaeon]|nr:hypothetical protein [Nanoarchaeota archaeon]
MDSSKRFKKKYFLGVLGSNIALLPFATGAICSMGYLVFENTPLALVGVFGILAGVGTFVYRFLVSPSEKIARKAQEEIEREDNEVREAHLNSLQEQFSNMRDSYGSKANNLLSSLRELYAEFTKNKEWQEGADRFSVSQTIDKVNGIFQHSLTFFEKIVELDERSKGKKVLDVKRKYERRIKQILLSLEEGVDILKTTLAGYHELAASQDESDNTETISQLGKQLDKHLRIAEEVSRKFSGRDSVDLETTEKPNNNKTQ